MDRNAAFPLICGQTVRGIEGQSVTLPCTYRVRKTDDITSMCWGCGSCLNSKCNDVLIWTDGHNIAGGQVSLTIRQASISDAGTYCCRIEHPGWFNDKKKNIQLNLEKAPKTTPPTTARRTTPIATTPRPTTRKQTVQPTTRKPTGPPVATVRTTALLPKPDIIPTPTPTPPGSITTTPTGEEPIETATMHTGERTTTPKTTTAVILLVPPLPPLPTVLHTTPTYTTRMDETSTLPSQSAGDSSENRISDLFSENITTVVKKESGFSLHILIIAIWVPLPVFTMVAVSLLILKFRGEARGRYPFGLDPNLELLRHAEAPLSETDVEISQTVTLEVDKVEASKPTL